MALGNSLYILAIFELQQGSKNRRSWPAPRQPERRRGSLLLSYFFFFNYIFSGQSDPTAGTDVAIDIQNAIAGHSDLFFIFN